MTPRTRVVVAVWPVLLCFLILGPALAPGFVLAYDMVFVPDLALRADFLGLGSALPRAVPSDAVVSVVDEVVPGMVLQKVVLVAALLLGGFGAQRLVPRDSALAQVAATSFYMWNPYVAERLGIGHWPVLLAYGALPWVFDAARRFRLGEPALPGLILWLALASLSAFGGLMAAAVALGATVDRTRTAWQRAGLIVVASLAVNATWLVAGLLHGEGARTDPAGAAAFAARPEGELPVALTLLGLGGIWNAEVVPSSRLGWTAPVMLVVWVLVCVAGARTWSRSLPAGGASSLVVLGVTGLLIGLAGPLTPGLAEAVVSGVPGGGLLRDGARYIALLAPAAASLFGVGAAHVASLVRRWAGKVPLSRVIAAATVLAPVVLLPDLGWGLAGRLQPVDFPHDYERARAAVAERDEHLDGVLLALPFIPYRLPEWNGDRRVIDPLGRYLTPNYLSSDDLYVDGARVRGEDPRAHDVRNLLQGATEVGDLEAALRRLGVRWVAVDREAESALGSALGSAGRAPQVGEQLVSTSKLEVRELIGEVAEPKRSPAVLAAVGAAWVTTGAVVGGAAALVVAGVLRRRRAGRGLVQ